ncbi:MAG: proton-conducting transporter membrane subunit [Anaerosomatales bacterium]|nr:proton-conducting transporter membrane subunit [Anaerosomatales bacterium]MDT8433690.1 proton-conducting transporter membrane subunit [Anaerosomatales bacterium]
MAEWIVRQLPALVILMPFTAAPLAYLLGAKFGRPIALVSALLSQPLALLLAIRVSRVGTLRYEVGGWGGPLGIDLVVDGVAAVMVLVTTVVGLFVTVYALGYFGDRERYRFFWPLWLFLWGSLLALFLSGDIFNLYVCLELVSMSAVALVGLTLSREALVAAMRYMLAAILGSLFYLLGVALIYGAFGSVDMQTLREVIRGDTTGQAALALMTVGLVLKTALFPLHFWLPPAHSNAPSPVSAVLSALVVKGSFYILVRLWVDVAQTAAFPGASTVLGVLGATAIFWGSIQALRQERLKMLVAYSTVAQIGYLFLMFPLVTGGGPAAADAWTGGVFHAVSHALAKSAMFLAAGTVLARFGHDRIEGLGGLSRRAPATAMTFGLAGVTMMGLPPSGGFVAKWQMIRASIESGQWWWAVVVVAGGLLAAAYVFKVLGPFFGREPEAMDEADLDPGPSPWTMEGAALALALGSLVLGVLGQPLLDLIMVSAPALVAGVTP